MRLGRLDGVGHDESGGARHTVEHLDADPGADGAPGRLQRVGKRDSSSQPDSTASADIGIADEIDEHASTPVL